MGDDAPGRWGPPSAEIEIFATGSTLVRAPDDEPIFEPWHPPAGFESPPTDDRERPTRGYHARPGHRPGVPVHAARAAPGSERQGRPTDVVRPLFVDPSLAVALVTDGGVLDGLPHLTVREPTGDSDRLLAWPVTVALPPHRRIDAILHLRASPSMVVTVLELMPTRRLRVGRRRFVSHSVATIEELARRIERRARGATSSPAAGP